jgi:hypothetical protein
MTSEDTTKLLRKLLEELTAASEVEATGKHATGAQFENFKQLDDQVSEIAERIDRLLG